MSGSRIDRIRIKNFQAHADRDIELEPVTTIIGPSDVGKSAIFRALRWVCRNQPQGADFVRHGESKASVDVVLEKNRITRSRTKSENSYLIDESVYKAFGSSVPDSVQELLKTDDISFQSQHDAPFWFSLTSGEVSRRINEIVDLSLVDHALSFVASKIRELKSMVTVCKDRVKKAKQDRSGIDWVKQAHIDLGLVEKKEKKQRGIHERLDNLYSLVGKIGVATADIIEHKRQVSRFGKLIDSARRMIDLNDDVNRILGILRQLDDLRVVADLSEMNFSDIKIWASMYHRVDRELFDIDRFLKQIERSRHEEELEREEAERLGSKLEEELEGVCPVCGGDWVG